MRIGNVNFNFIVVAAAVLLAKLSKGKQTFKADKPKKGAK